MKKFLTLAVFAVFCQSAFCAGYTAKTDPVLKTMEAEIKRSMPKLKKAKEPVYFLSYYINDTSASTFLAVLGGVQQMKSRYASLDTEARAGSRRMDNTRKIKEINFDLATTDIQDSAAAPLEADTKVLRQILWLDTEETVKKAQEMFQKVKTNSLTAAARSDDSDDFSAPLPPISHYDSAQMPVFDEEVVKDQLKEYSLMFKGYDFIFTSQVVLSITVENIYYVNSEGAKIKRPRVLMRLSYAITSRNQDGMQLERVQNYDFIDINNMPSPDIVKADMQKSIAELKALQNAPVADTFHGPAILKNRATGVFFHEILGHRIEGHRQKDDDFGQTFTQKLGQQVISPIISVSDNPKLREFKGIPLRGFYLFDDEGVPAQDVSIIKDGILKGFLMSRSPIKGFPQSNGHGRKEPGFSPVSRMGITIIDAKETVSYGELRQKLIEEIKKQGKPYGLIIEDISGGFTRMDTYGPQSFKVKPLLVYKVYPDNRPDELIRGADIVGTPLASFNKIIAAADDSDVFNGNCWAESGWVPVSAIAPSVLVSEIEVEKVEKSYDSPPILPPPGAAIKEAK